MDKKDVSRILSVGLTTSMVLTPISESGVIVNANGLTSKYSSLLNSEGVEDSIREQIYLSDLECEKGSGVGYGKIVKDANPDGTKIRLLVDGEVKEFDRGIGAHATSTLIYNVEDYKDVYSRFVGYLGVDNRQSGRGDGVLFSIYTSKDGTTWDLVKEVGTVTASQESVYVEIDIKDANYIKLYAHENGGKGNDHSVYGDAKLVKEDYSLAGTPIEGLKPLSEYDSELRGNSINENITNDSNKEIILKRALVKRVGYESIQRISAQDPKYSEGINYLMTNMVALEYFIMGGPVNIDGSYQRSLKAFCDIYAKYKHIMDDSTDDYFNLRLAVSIALAYGRVETVSSWIKSDKGVNPVHRYEVYQYLVSSRKMDEGGGNTNDSKQFSTAEFKALSIPMMRWSVDVRLSDDEILWMVDYALSEKAKNKNHFDAYNYIEYTMGHNHDNPEYYKEENREKYNKKYNFENYFNDYGTKGVQRMWMVFEEGAVCGGLTQTYSILSDIFGRPSTPCGQPGHAAAVTYEWNRTNQRYEWVIQNDISGWMGSGNQFDDRMLGWGNQWRNSWSTWTNASYTVLASDAVKDWDKYVETHYYNLLADSYNDNDIKKECYKKALELQNINLDAWEGLINCYKSDRNATSSQFLELAKGVISSYNYYPQTMMELLGYIDDNITDANDIVQLDILTKNALLRATQATKTESTNIHMTKQTANYYLNGDKVSELATFSFDGVNANKIVLNSKYEGSKIRVQYSLDGGYTWEYSDEHSIELSEDEISSITAEKDIKIGLVGGTDIYTIDILPGKSITTSIIYGNDNENKLIGAIDNLEFSLDGGKTWCDYVVNRDEVEVANDLDVTEDGCIVFEGNKTVKVRYKANGVYLRSNTLDYVFTEDSKDYTKKYIPIKNVSLVECSREHSSNHLGKHLLDGTPNTGYHTPFNVTTEDKFVTVKFDKVRYINSIEYQSNGNNGKLRNGKIYTSMDGKNWTLAGSFNELGRNNTLKTINLDSATACRYLKLEATNTYGNNQGEYDMYLSGNMLNFYEDATKEYVVEPIITYSTEFITNGNVEASIELPDGCELIGESSYTFENNGTYAFKYIDANGVQQSVEAKVDWIDKVNPTADVVYSTQEATNKSVTVSLENISDDATVISKGGSNIVFETNGSHIFILEDKAGNITEIPVSVNWIDKEGPTIKVSYSEENPTNKDVVVTISGLKEGEYVDNNGGLTTYTFTENGIFEFVVKDKAGNVTKVPVSVNWIDKVVPTASIEYDVLGWTNGDVVAKLVNLSEEVTILDGGMDKYTFTENGTYTFKFKDKAGNMGSVEAKVSWIDKTKPEENKVVEFDKGADKVTSSVKVTLNIDLNEVEVLNNGGSVEYVFTENKTYVFRLRLKSTGYEFDYPVTVSWITEDDKVEDDTIEDSNGGTAENDKVENEIPKDDVVEDDTIEDSNGGTAENDKVENEIPKDDVVEDNNSSSNGTVGNNNNNTSNNGGNSSSNNTSNNSGNSSNNNTSNNSGNSSNNNTSNNGGNSSNIGSVGNTNNSGSSSNSNTSSNNVSSGTTSSKPSTNTNINSSNNNASNSSSSSSINSTDSNNNTSNSSSSSSNSTDSNNSSNITSNNNVVVDTGTNTSEIVGNIGTSNNGDVSKGETELGSSDVVEGVKNTTSNNVKTPIIVASVVSILGVLAYFIKKYFKK